MKTRDKREGITKVERDWQRETYRQTGRRACRDMQVARRAGWQAGILLSRVQTEERVSAKIS